MKGGYKVDEVNVEEYIEALEDVMQDLKCSFCENDITLNRCHEVCRVFVLHQLKQMLTKLENEEGGNKMKKGVTRRFDGHGRILIPAMMLELAGLANKGEVEILVRDKEVILRRKISHDGHLHREEGGSGIC